MEHNSVIEYSQELVDEIDQYLKQLFPINRSITGPGNRESLKILQEIVPLEIKEYPSGKQVYDWTIPDEWQVRDAWIKDSSGNVLVDFQDSNIHLVGYSTPIDKNIRFEELKSHLHTHTTLPNAIPYRTTYYKKDWGFCVTKDQYERIAEIDGELEVYIDSDFDPQGSLTIGELLIPGKTEQEILISTYICHPSLANDNLSGMVMTAFLARELLKLDKLKRSYRITWVPETIGTIAYCFMNEEKIKKIQSGLVVTTVGGPGKFGYKQSFNHEHSINLIIEDVFNKEGIDYKIYPFDIHGSDERQYSSQGFRINMASLTKDKYYEYDYYHSSLDDLEFVKSEHILDSLFLHLNVLDNLNYECMYKSNYTHGEVMLSKHDLYPKTGGAQLPIHYKINRHDMILWLIWLCDGKTGLIEISKTIKVDIKFLKIVISELLKKGILEEVKQ